MEDIMQLTRFTDYGLRVLMYLAARPADTASVKVIAAYYGISRNHLVKVVHRLSQLGYINTTKGKGGGIQIADGTDAQRIGDLIAQLEPDMNIVECFDAKTNQCRITDHCALKHFLHEATQNFLDTMNKYTLADTVRHKTSPFTNTAL